jgi:dihydrolipoamide dehydrogenase
VTFTPADGKQQKVEAEKILIAVGRAPRTDNVGLEKTKIKPERGFIKTNEWMQTSEPGVYAIGDIVLGMPQLAHVGSMQGIVAVAKMTGKPAKPVHAGRIPNCTYCEPQIGSVGLRKPGQEAGRKVSIVCSPSPPTQGFNRGSMRLHQGGADAQYGEILVHIIGPSATELIRKRWRR